MNFDKFNQILETRWNYGEIENADIVSEYKNVGCGDAYRLYLNVQEDQIKDAKYTTTGCSFSLASLAIACELLKNSSLKEAKEITPDKIEAYLDGFPERRKNYAVTAIQAVNKVIADFEKGKGLPQEKVITRENTLDKLKRQGHLKKEKLNSVMLDKLDLQNIDFSDSDLQNAYLKEANLSGTNLSNCNLRGAFLDGADLSGANLSNSDLRFAKLTNAKFDGTNFQNALYDIGTRVHPKDLYIFENMKKVGKDVYLKAG